MPSVVTLLKDEVTSVPSAFTEVTSADVKPSLNTRGSHVPASSEITVAFSASTISVFVTVLPPDEEPPEELPPDEELL